MVKRMGFPAFYLFLHAVDFRPQPLDVAVELGDLLLGVAEVVPVPACGSLQLLVLWRREEQPVKVKSIIFSVTQCVARWVLESIGCLPEPTLAELLLCNVQ